MNVKVFSVFPDDAEFVRRTVFIDEQGFQSEIDEKDETATHIVMYNDDGEPVAACRIFLNEEKGAYILGRLAVLKQYRENNLGSEMVREAEKAVIANSGDSLHLHAQLRVKDFYVKCGYAPYGDVEYEEGCPHIWMKKSL